MNISLEIPFRFGNDIYRPGAEVVVRGLVCPVDGRCGALDDVKTARHGTLLRLGHVMLSHGDRNKAGIHDCPVW